MEIIIIPIVALLASMLTFFSGFGLGTILLPAFSIFFPVELSIAMTGIVHFTNNLFKLMLVGKKADFSVILKFGLPAVIAAFIGAKSLMLISDLSPLTSYTLVGKSFDITITKIIIGLILIAFSVIEIIPRFKSISFDKNKLVLGGLLSGFFGGLSGIQGALRSAFLIKIGLSKEVYIATGVVLAALVDISRLSVYSTQVMRHVSSEHWTIISISIVSAIIGAIVGNKLLKKITINLVHTLVTIMLVIIGLLLAIGLI